MELTRALDRIAEIHDQLAKGEVFRGYRPMPLAMSGLVAIVAASASPRIVPWLETSVGPERAFVAFWILVATVNIVICGRTIVTDYLFEDDSFARRRTRRVVAQFLPALAGGAGATAAIVLGAPAATPHLPGLWSLLFGLGLFSSRPYLPRAIGWVALFYLAAGIGLLFFARTPSALDGWRVGGIFGPGQLATAAVLWWNLERKEAN